MSEINNYDTTMVDALAAADQVDLEKMKRADVPETKREAEL